jgi:hypothetical protein
MIMDGRKTLYGVMAEFDSPRELVAASRAAREAGFTKMDGYSPFPIHEMDEALGIKRTILPYLIFAAGILGGTGGFMLQYYTHAIDYPLNVGGRPFLSIPSFIPITFECIVLAAALTAVVGMIILNGLPQPYHPVFNAPRFALASRDKFFLAIESSDPKFDHDETTQFLQNLDAREVFDVTEDED